MKIIVDDRLTTFMCLREIYSIVNCYFWFPYSESFAVRGLQASIWTTSGSGLGAAGLWRLPEVSTGLTKAF